jgi:L-ascorbate metabolism protein UlaG (beta-lactamase superfamily)
MQDHFLDKTLLQKNVQLHEKIVEPPQSKFGLTYQPLNQEKIAQLSTAEKIEVEAVRTANNQATLGKVAILPALMFVCYFSLILYYRSRGGYRPQELIHKESSP